MANSGAATSQNNNPPDASLVSTASTRIAAAVAAAFMVPIGEIRATTRRAVRVERRPERLSRDAGRQHQRIPSRSG